MAATQLPKTGLKKSADNDVNWGADLRDGFDAFEARIGKSFVGDPNGNVAGEWLGQTCRDTANGITYECVTVGNTVGAVWEARQKDEPGTFKVFFRTTLPTGWLPLDGSPRDKALYPALWAALPIAFKTDTTFTLPNLTNPLALIISGSADIGSIVGSASTSSVADHNHTATASIDDPGYDTVEENYFLQNPPPGKTALTSITVHNPTVAVAPAGAHFHTVAVPGFRLLAGIKT